MTAHFSGDVQALEKSGRVKLIVWVQTSSLTETMWSYKYVEICKKNLHTLYLGAIKSKLNYKMFAIISCIQCDWNLRIQFSCGQISCKSKIIFKK